MDRLGLQLSSLAGASSKFMSALDVFSRFLLYNDMLS
ncbi:uncharacterized protein J3R85_006819 [Psidium guajava]|nr:uncharacterized protein J3R85_006819 [Psidium guajava]